MDKSVLTNDHAIRLEARQNKNCGLEKTKVTVLLWFYNAKESADRGHCKKPSHPIAPLGAHIDHLMWCSARGESASEATPRKPHLLSVLIRPSGLVDVHPVLVLPPGSPCGTLARVLLLPQAVCDLLEHRVERFLVLGVLEHFGGAVVRERYELRV